MVDRFARAGMSESAIEAATNAESIVLPDFMNLFTAKEDAPVPPCATLNISIQLGAELSPLACRI